MSLGCWSMAGGGCREIDTDCRNLATKDGHGSVLCLAVLNRLDFTSELKTLLVTRI